MNKKISTLLVGVLLATSVGNAADVDPNTSALRTGDKVFLKNAALCLKITPDGKGIVPITQPAANAFASYADIDSVSWEVTVNENAGAKKEFIFKNVANGLALSFAQPGGAEGATDSAKVSGSSRAWGMDAVTAGGYALGYKFSKGTPAVDSLVVLGVKAADPSLELQKIALTTDFATSVKSLDAAYGWNISLTDREDAIAAYEAIVENVVYKELQTPVLTTTDILGFNVPFMVKPVKTYNTVTGEVAFYGAAEADSTDAKLFMFVPASELGKANPNYLAIDTSRYIMAGIHDASFGSKLSMDTLAITGGDNIDRNGLKVFSVLRKPSNPDSLVFRPAAKVVYADDGTFTVAANPSDYTVGGVAESNAYDWATDEIVIGKAIFETVDVVTTVVAKDADRKEGKLVPFNFVEVTAPKLLPGNYLVESMAAGTKGQFVISDPCGAYDMDTVATASATRSANVWQVSVNNGLVSIANWRYPSIEIIKDKPIVETALNTYKTVDGIEFKVDTADAKVNDFYTIKSEDIPYNMFSFRLVNGLGENKYIVKNASDSLLAVSLTDGELRFNAVAQTPAAYNGADLKATGYKFNYKAGNDTYYLGFVKSKLAVSRNAADAAVFYFENGTSESSYYVRVVTNDGDFLNAYATDNYFTTVDAADCPAGQDQFAVDMTRTFSYKTLAPGHYEIKTVGRADMLTRSDLAADTTYGVFRRPEGDGLKAESKYDENAFKLWVDTAAYNADQKLYEPTYFIVGGVSNEVASGVSELSGHFLKVAATDTARFITATREATQDSLMITATKKVKGNDMQAFRFKFQYADKAGDELYLVSEAGTYVKIVNESLVSTPSSSDAMKVTVERVTAPTDNADIDEVSGINVVAGKGTVTIQNAAGKKVAITNILGQVIATSVISSDNATISVPAGVAIISVDGEESAKAIVK